MSLKRRRWGILRGMEIQMQNAEAVGLEQIRAFPLTRLLRGHDDFRRATWG